MNPWPFVIAAWGLTIVASAVLALAAWRAMRAAERAAEELTRR